MVRMKKLIKNWEEIIQDNLEYNTRLKLSNRSKDKSLPIMYWIPKLNKNPIGSQYIIASKKCLMKPLSKAVSNIFKLIYSQIENSHHKSKSITNSGYSKMLILSLKILTL